MQSTAAYLPEDRRIATSAAESAQPVHRRVRGTVLFVDISGFTPLTAAFVAALGRRRGADATTRQLNTIYSSLIACIHRYGGTIIGFSGDGMLCWYDAASREAAAAARRALAAAAAVQQTMDRLSTVQVGEGMTIRLAVKTAVTSGPAVRWMVGDPAIQRIDVLAGATVDRAAAAERLAGQGETIIDRTTAALIPDDAIALEWRDARQIYASVAPVCLRALQSALPPPPLSPDPAMHVPSAWGESWLLPALRTDLGSGEARLLGELRPAAALFIRFGGLDFDADARAPAAMDAYVRWLQSLLERHEGALIQLTTGDKGSYIYAVFGAPVAHDDDLQRAAATARILLDPPPALDYRPMPQIGLAAGQMRVGAYGSETRCTYGVQGAAVNRAAQLMLHAAPAQILTDQGTAALLTESHDIEPAGEARLKGEAGTVQLFAVGPRRTRTPLTATTVFNTELRGRESMLAELQQRWTAVKAGRRGSLVRIRGEAGIGKSHLLAEFIGRAKADGDCVVAVATCRSTEPNRLFYAARQIARWMLGLGERAAAPAADQIAHITAYLGALDPAWLPRLPLLADLLALPIAENDLTSALTPQQRREALLDLVAEIVTVAAAGTPIVLVADDVQLIDEASLTLLTYLARALEQSAVLMVIAQRPGPDTPEQVEAALDAIQNQQQLTVAPLDLTSSADVIADRLDGQVSPLVTALIGARAQGNPLMLEALVDTLREGSQIVRSAPGTWDLAPSMLDQLRRAHVLDEQTETPRLLDHAAELELGLPDSIHGLILARLDRLPAAARSLLKVASVLGPAFDRELLAAMQPDIRTSAAGQMGLLPPAAEQFIHPIPGRTERIRFHHNVTQEVIYQTLLDDQRRRLHLRAAQALEALAPEAVEKLAHHYVNSPLDSAPLRGRCLEYLDRAAARAQRDYANETALQYLDQALDIEADWPRLRRKVDLLHLLGRRDEEAACLAELERMEDAPVFERQYAYGLYYEAISSYDDALAAMDEALIQARSAGNREQEARALARLGLVAWRQGDTSRAAAYYEDALAILGTDARYADEEADTHYGLGLVYRQIGQYDQARARFDRALEIYRTIGHRPSEAKTLIAIGHVEHYRNDLAAAMEAYEAALPIYRTTGDRAGVGTSLLSLAQANGSIGDHAKALALLKEALIRYEGVNDTWSTILVYNELGIVDMMLGNWDAARRHLEVGLQLSRAIDDQSGIAYTMCNLGQVLRDMQKLEQASQCLNDGLALAREQQDRHLAASYLQDLARVELQRDRLDAAEAYAQASIEEFVRLALPENNITNLTTLAEVYGKSDKVASALNAAREARRLLDEGAADSVTFPQREYWICAEILAGADTEHARRCLDAARYWMHALADRISDAHVRQAYLQNHAFHRAILASRS